MQLLEMSEGDEAGIKSATWEVRGGLPTPACA